MMYELIVVFLLYLIELNLIWYECDELDFIYLLNRDCKRNLIVSVLLI